MNKIYYRIAILALLCLSALRVSAQDITAVHGVVNDELGAIIGASVCEIDANGRIVESTITDINGNFSMKIRNPKNKIRFSYIGYKAVSLAINKTDSTPSMKPSRDVSLVSTSFRFLVIWEPEQACDSVVLRL